MKQDNFVRKEFRESEEDLQSQQVKKYFLKYLQLLQDLIFQLLKQELNQLQEKQIHCVLFDEFLHEKQSKQ